MTAFIFISCTKEKCVKVGALKCSANKVKICSSKKEWILSKQCGANLKCGSIQTKLGKIVTCLKKVKDTASSPTKQVK